ncbi:TLD-domain-containing protein, partial [Backusella circina FSU 941]
SLLYSLDQHGASLSTLYRNCANQGPCLLAIQNTEDEVFGAYLSEGFQPQQSYYGNGECFLWRWCKKKKQVDIYPWTNHNDYLMYSNHDFLAIGGGKGHFGLWLDLTHGYSEPCMTFNNPSLASKSSFECLAIEIWCFAY